MAATTCSLTVFDDVDSSMRIAQEEIFGPVISLIRARDFDDALAKANDIGFGLVGRRGHQ